MISFCLGSYTHTNSTHSIIAHTIIMSGGGV